MRKQFLETLEKTNFYNGLDEEGLVFNVNHCLLPGVKDELMVLINELLENPGYLISYQNQDEYKDTLLCQLGYELFYQLLGIDVTNKLKDDFNLRVQGGKDYFQGSNIRNKGHHEIVLNNLSSIYSVPTLNHELMHYITYNNHIVKNYANIDILPIFIELLTADYLSNSPANDDMLDNLIMFRLNFFKELIDNFRIAKINYSDGTAYSKINYQYYKDTMFQYISDFIFAYNMYLRYLEDNQLVSSKVSKTIKDIRPVEHLLADLELELNKEQVGNVLKLVK